jgi:ribosomal protein S21
VNSREFDKAFAKIRKEFRHSILPELKRRQFYLSPSEKRRVKHRKAIKRLRKRELNALARGPTPSLWGKSNKEWKFFD